MDFTPHAPGFVESLKWWKDSGIELKNTNLRSNTPAPPVDEPSNVNMNLNADMAIVEWWKQSRLEIKNLGEGSAVRAP
ncbi:hypothetical protein BJ742DRAFT_775673 [Cladochytrium replicatum]|nr:hypothetical protein BJ742DRAFT_775673 [Cladochytrium replicatum]